MIRAMMVSCTHARCSDEATTMMLHTISSQRSANRVQSRRGEGMLRLFNVVSLLKNEKCRQEIIAAALY
jgi:hypothetical protein